MVNHKLLATLVSGVAFLYSQEISVYDAGNLNSSNPYGLTDSEKTQLQNRQLSQNISSIDSSLDEAMQRIEGLQSIIDGLNSRMAKLEKRVSDLEGGNLGESGITNSSEISELRKYVEESRAIQESNNEKITKALQDMGTLIDKSNSKKTIDKINDEDKSASAKSEEASQKYKQDFSKQTNSDVSNEAKKFFETGKLEDAKARYEYLLNKGHKPAMANFYLGEISYQQKAYNEAIQYYQKSIELYDKADYTPKLLYHTAISFDKIKDTQSANRFYKALKLGYPDSKEAKASPDRK
jgi:tetratricopeptide repeat protein